MLEIELAQIGQHEDGTPNYGLPEERKPSLVKGLATFAASHVIGSAIFLGVGCALASISPALVPVYIIGLALTREY